MFRQPGGAVAGRYRLRHRLRPVGFGRDQGAKAGALQLTSDMVVFEAFVQQAFDGEQQAVAVGVVGDLGM